MDAMQPFDCGKRAAVVVTRGPIVESEHFACYAVVDLDARVVESNGDIDRPVYLRSSAKPLIATAVVAGGAADRFGLSDEEIAIVAGSHGGEPKQVEAVRSILYKAGLDEQALRCGAHAPSHQPSADALCSAGQLPMPIHNNCSGKHAGILALAMHLGAGPHDYLSPEHPAQQAILQTCSDLLKVKRDELAIGVDGCGIPVIAVGLKVAAAFYARLGSLGTFPERLRPALDRVRAAMLAHPYFVAGTKRFDTELMETAGGAVLAKGGAEGYHGSAALERGLGMAVKIADGNYRAVAPFVLSRMRAWNVLSAEQLARLSEWVAPIARNHAGKAVGEVRTVKPYSAGVVGP